MYVRMEGVWRRKPVLLSQPGGMGRNVTSPLSRGAGGLCKLKRLHLEKGSRPALGERLRKSVSAWVAEDDPMIVLVKVKKTNIVGAIIWPGKPTFMPQRARNFPVMWPAVKRTL